MREDSNPNRRWWVTAAVALFGAAVLGRGLIHSGTIAADLLTPLPADVAQALIVLPAALAGMFCLNRAFRH